MAFRPITLASTFGGPATVKLLVEKLGADVNERGFEGRNCVLAAAAGGQNEVLIYFHETRPDLFKAKDDEGNTALQTFG